MKKLISLALILSFLLTIPVAQAEDTRQTIKLTSTEAEGKFTHSATLDGKEVPQYDYTWHIDPTKDHKEVKNSPAEYYTGTKSEGDGVYIAHDIYYYPQIDQSKFQKVNYDGETEWVSFYEAPGYEKYIFSTLPNLRTGFPSQMMHSAEEAYANAVLHITQPGTYALEGSWHGQIRIDLGEDAFDDPTQKVKLILNGVDITCTVAPGVVFASVYECDNGWEDAEEHSHKVDTTEAGATVILADGTTNNVSGTNIFRILKTQYKDEESQDTYPAQKKRLKTDGAFYSYQSLNIDGETAGTGVLNITAGYEGLNSELHLSVNGGNVNIFSQDDGINVNEDGVSVLSVNGGSLHICAGLGAEGDGIDSNGYVVVNGGTVISAANPGADSGLDSDKGSYVLGGTVVALGSTMDWAKAEGENATQAIVNMRFTDSQSSEDAILITDEKGKVVFAYDPDKDEVSGKHSRSYTGAVVSAPGLQVGKTYQLYVGGDVTGTEVSGVYDAASVTDFTGATQQCISSNTVGGMGRPNFQRPEGNFERPNKGERPEGFTPPEGNEGVAPPEGTIPFTPSDFTPAEGAKPISSQLTGATCTYERNFALSQAVNAFSVTDVRHNYENGICTACQAADPAAPTQPTVTEPTKPEPSEPGIANDRMILFALGAVCGGALVALIFTVVLLIKKFKK